MILRPSEPRIAAPSESPLARDKRCQSSSRQPCGPGTSAAPAICIAKRPDRDACRWHPQDARYRPFCRYYQRVEQDTPYLRQRFVIYSEVTMGRTGDAYDASKVQVNVPTWCLRRQRHMLLQTADSGCRIL